jgi:hypothetical protein
MNLDLNLTHIHSSISTIFFPLTLFPSKQTDFKWSQSSPDRSCEGLNCGPPYQVQRQSPLNRFFTCICLYNFFVIKYLSHISFYVYHLNIYLVLLDY